MLTNALPDPGTPTPADTSDKGTSLLGLKVRTMLEHNRIRRGQLALGLYRLREDYKAATGVELLPQDRADACMELINQCIRPPSGPLVDICDGLSIPTDLLPDGMEIAFLAVFLAVLTRS